MEIELTVPAPEYLEAYHDFCKETWGHVHDSYILHDPAAFSVWKNTIFRQYENEKNGIGLLLMTCAEDNLPSIRINEAFPFTRMERDEFVFDGVVKKIRRYWRELERA